MKKIRIVAAIVDTVKLTLYTQEGKTLTYPQGDYRVRPILDQAMPQLMNQGWAEIEIPNVENSYKKFEEKSGVVKFFSVAKDKLLNLFAAKVEEENTEPVPPMSIGQVPSSEANKMNVAIEDILKNATPVASVDFSEETIARQNDIVNEDGSTPPRDEEEYDAPDTIVALVDGKIIPGLEKIKNQLARAVEHNSLVGVENFLKRLAGVIDKRSHSVADLLKFLERADLPITEDGSILIYKVLSHAPNEPMGIFVDCHTRKVKQWVGAYVCMDEKLVDHNRNNECSNGLHVARRGYIREFSGDVCVMAKLAPEDVIAVPTYDANKMRVCGYHIIAQLTPEQYALLRNNKPITDDPSGKILLGQAMTGTYVKTHEVRITGQMGEGVVTTDLKPVLVTAKKPAKKVEVTALENSSKQLKSASVDPKNIASKVEQLSRKEIAEKLYKAFKAARGAKSKQMALDELKLYKKRAKVSWAVLGFTTAQIEEILSH